MAIGPHRMDLFIYNRVLAHICDATWGFRLSILGLALTQERMSVLPIDDTPIAGLGLQKSVNQPRRKSRA